MNLTPLSREVSVRPQLLPHEVADVAAAGFRGIINNRPDHEAPDQPSSEQIEAEAKRHGLAYWHIPIVPGQATEKAARAFAAAVREAGGPVVAFCRTGNRSTSLWKMTQRGS
jgi:sulfide:quinone oxidoreductase